MLFDGVCSLCNGTVQFVLRRDRQAAFRFAPLQSRAAAEQLARVGAPNDMTTFVLIANANDHPRVLTKARAALFVARTLGWPWKAAGVLGLLPTGWLDRVYDLVARHRYRVFGKRDACMLPRPEQRRRFLDDGVSPQQEA